MPYGYGSANQSGTSSGRETVSNYGQFDRAVSRAANNPPASTPSGNGNNKEKATIEAILKAVTTPKAPPSILNPYVPPTDDRVPDRVKQIIDRPTIAPRAESDYKQSLVDTTNYKDKIGKSLFGLGLGKIHSAINPAMLGWNALSSIFGWGKKVDPYSTLKSTLSKRKTTPKTGIETIELGDGKTDIETIARGGNRQFEQPTVQQAISKGEGLESGRKLLGLSDEETNYFKKLFASRDRKFLQSIFDKGTIRIQSGKATQKEQDVYTLLQQYLVDPRDGIMGVA